MQRLMLTAAVVAALLAAGAATAVATPDTLFGHASAKQATGETTGSVRVRLDVNEFITSGRRLVAHGTAIATYTPQTGEPTHRRLEPDSPASHADPNGGILGSLLCSVTNPPPPPTTA